LPLASLVPPALRRRRDVGEKKPQRALGAADLASAAGRALPERTGYVPGIPQGGVDEYSQAIGASTGTDRRTLLSELYDAYLTCPWSWTCVQVIARTVTAGGLVTDWDADTGEGDQEEPEKPPEVVALERFWSFCNPTQDVRQILRNAVADLLVFGDAMLEVVWSGPVPVAIFNQDVATTYPVADEHGTITGYVQLTDFGQRAEFGEREIIHISLDSARPGTSGVAPTQAVTGPITNWLFASALEMQMLRKGLPPTVHADLAAGTSQTETERWRNQASAQNLGARNVGVPWVTRGGGKLSELQTGKLADVLAAKDKARDEIVAGYGVPPAEANIIESGNLGGGTGDSQHRSFMINTCDPIGEILLEKINYHIALRGFGVRGWRSKFAEVDYRDSVVIEQIRDMRLRNGTWTQNRYRAEIGEPAIEGGDTSILVERQLVIASKDVQRYSDALIASLEMQGVPGAGAPSQESAQQRRARLREALAAYHATGRISEAADAAAGDDGDAATAGAVYAQLARSFPAADIGWVKSAEWTGPERVPLDHIDMADKAHWTASHQPSKVARLAARIRGRHALGKGMRPVVLVQAPGAPKLVIADGHHRVLAYQQASQAPWAYVGKVDSDSGGWDTMHAAQLRAETAA
jgi:hypothetical protein